MKRSLISIFIGVLACCLSAFADDFNPTNPGDPSPVYTLQVQVSPHEGGTPNISRTMVSAGQKVSLSVSLNENYTFKRWVCDGEQLSTKNSYRYTMPARNVTIIAEVEYTPQPFDPTSPPDPSTPDIHKPHTVTIQVSPEGAGSASYSTLTLEEGEQKTIYAYPNSQYVFSGWYMNDSLLTDQSSYRLTMPNQDIVLRAVFLFDPNSPNDPGISMFLPATAAEVLSLYLNGYVASESTAMQYDAQYDSFSESFESYQLNTDYQADYGFVCVEAENENQARVMLAVMTGTDVNGLPAGTYPIMSSGEALSVWASPGMDNGKVFPSFAGYMHGRYVVPPIWFLQSGSVTISATGYMDISALNSNNRPITITLNNPIDSTVLLTHSEHGNVLGSGVYSWGECVQIEATPDDGYVFAYWSDFSTENPRMVCLYRDTILYTAVCLPIDSAVYDLCLADVNERSAYFIKPDSWGENINCYMWHEGTYNELTNTWPGNRATAFNERLYKFKIPYTWDKNYDDWMIIWNDGTRQSEDHHYVKNGVYSVVTDVSYNHGNITTINYVCTQVCPDTIINQYDTICEGKPYEVNARIYSSGDYRFDSIYISSRGGDSIIHYHLHVHYCEPVKYTITFVNYDGTVLQSSKVEENTLPVYIEETPQKTHALRWAYIFKGWTPTIGIATSDTIYTALYDSIISYDCEHLIPITSIDTIDSARVAEVVSSVKAKIGIHYDGHMDIDTLALHNGIHTLVNAWNNNPLTTPVFNSHIALSIADFSAKMELTDVCGNYLWKDILVDVYPTVYDTVRTYGIIPDTITSIISMSVPYSTVKYDSVAVHITKCAPNLSPLGLFNHLSPADSAVFDNTNLTLNWNLIEDALFSVYLWDAAEGHSPISVAEYISDIRYQPTNLQFGHTYHWFVQAQSCEDHIVSDTMTFTIRELPDLHVTSLDISDAEAEQPITVTWSVRNDGIGSTGQQRWTDYIWLVNDVYDGTQSLNASISLPKLLTSVDNVKSLDSGEQYENSVTVKLPDNVYGDIYVVVSSDMYNISNIEWNIVGGAMPNPYNPQESGWLYATTNAHDNKIYEQGETPTHSDNFFYKRIHLDMPPYVDLQIPLVTAEAVPLNPPYITNYGNVALTCIANKKYYDPSDAEPTRNKSAKALKNDIVQLYQPSPVTYTGAAFNTDFYCGKEVLVHATVANYGNKTLSSCGWNSACYISHSPNTIDEPLMLMKTAYVVVDSLAPEDSTIISFLFNLPYDWNGDTYFHVYTDMNDQVQEFANTANNWGVSDAANVKWTPYADLQPANLQIRTNGVLTETLTAGQPITLSYVVNNTGAGIPYNGKWIDKLYWSTSPNGIDATASQFSVLTNTGIFEKSSRAEDNAVLVNRTYYIRLSDFIYKGDNYSRNVTLTTPALPSGTYYLYVNVDADDNVFEGEGETNNILCSGPIQITTADLAADHFAVSQDTLATGDIVAITWKVRNEGIMPLQNTKLVDVLYATTGANHFTPIEVATLENTVSLPIGGEKTLRANITVPRNQALDGTMNLYMMVNKANSVSENDKTNNISQQQQVVFEYLENGSERIINGMAIKSTSLVVENTVCHPGDTLHANVTITNIGTKTIPLDVTKDLWLMPGSSSSLNEAVATQLEVLACTGSTNQLVPKQSVNIAITALLPSDKRGGENRLFFIADRNNALKTQKRDKNNTSSDIFIQGNIPDVVISDIYCKDTLFTSVEDTISFTISNNGTWVSLTSTTHIYLSADRQPDRNDIELAHLTIPVLQPEEQRAFRVPVTIDDKHNGTWYLIVKNGDKYEAVQLVVNLSPLPDLQISDLQISELLLAGDKMQITYTVTNKGTVATRTDRWADDFYFCSTSSFDISKAIRLSSRAHYGKVEPDSSYTCMVEFTIPPSLQGNYRFFVRTDAADAIVETNEQNNLSSQQVYINNGNDRPADLVISAVNMPATIIAGQPVTFTYTVANRGEYPATGILRDVFYFSTDDRLDGNDMMVGVASGAINLAVGEETVRTATGVITNITEGNYTLIVTTNSTHGIAERSYENNTAISASPVTVQFLELPLESEQTCSNTAYYKLEVSSGMENQTLAIDLRHPESRIAGLYVAYNHVPSAARYEYTGVRLDNSSQQLILPHVKSGTYYIMAQDYTALTASVGNEFSLDAESGSAVAADMTLFAKQIPFGASSLTISEGGEGGWITTGINGALFENIMDFRLAKDVNVLPAEVVTWDGATQSMVTFNLNNAALGKYDVVSELPDGTVGTLEDAFNVVEGKEIGVSVKLDVPEFFRPNTAIPFSFFYANGGTTDDAISEFLIVIDNGWLSFDVQGLEEQSSELHYRPHGETNTRGYVSIPPGEQKIVNAYYRATGNTCKISIYILK